MTKDQTLTDSQSASTQMESPAAEQTPLKPTTPFNAFSFTASLLNHRGILSLFDQAIVSGTNFLSGMIIGRFSGKDEFGLYMLGMTIILIGTELQTSLITTPYMVFSPKMGTMSRTGYNGSVLLHQVAFSCITALMLCGAGIILSFGFGPPGLGTVISTLALFGILILFRDYVRRILFARLHMQKAFILDTFVSAAQLAGLSILAYSGLLSAVRAYVVIGSVSGFMVCFWIIFSRKERSFSFNRTKADALKNWTFGKWVFASGLVWTLSMNMYPWFITFFHGTSSTGIWAACMGVMGLCNPVLLGIQNYLGPRIAAEYAHHSQAKLKTYVYKSSVKFVIMLFPVFLVLIFFGEKLLVAIYGSQYAGNGIIVGLLGINLMISAVIFSFSRALYAIERASIDFKVNFSALAVLFTVGIWLVRTKGLLGAAIGLITANLVSSCIRGIIFLRLVTDKDARKP